MQPIYSDDPRAVEKLRAKLEMLERLQERMKLANTAIRKHKKAGANAQVAALVALNIGIDETGARSLLKPDFCGRIGFADYETQNNNANIRQIKERIEALTQVTA